MWSVKRVYWDAEGGYHAELVPMQVRPTQRIAESIPPPGPGELPYREPWDDEEEPEPLLLAAGWRRHGDEGVAPS